MPASKARKARRALLRGAATAAAINAAAGERQCARANGQAGRAQGLDDVLEEKFGALREQRRDVYHLGVPEGQGFEGKPSSMGRWQ